MPQGYDIIEPESGSGFDVIEPEIPPSSFADTWTKPYEQPDKVPYEFGVLPFREAVRQANPTPDDAAAGQGLAAGVGNATFRAGATGVGDAIKAVPFFSQVGVGFEADVPPLFAAPEVQKQQLDDAERMLRRMRQTPLERLKEVQADPIYQFGKSITEGAKEAFPVSEENRKKTILGVSPVGVGEAIGGLVPLVASAGLAPVTIGMQSLGSHLENDYNVLMTQEGMTPQEAANKTINRALMSGVAAATIFAVLPKPLRNLGDKYIIDRFGETALKRFAAARAAGAAEGAILMPAAHAAENIVSDRPVTEGLPESAVAGAAMIGLSPRGLTEKEQVYAPLERATRPASKRSLLRQSLRDERSDAGITIPGLEWENLKAPVPSQNEINRLTRGPTDQADFAKAQEWGDIADETVRAELVKPHDDRQPVKGVFARLSGMDEELRNQGFRYDSEDDTYHPLKQPPKAIAPEAVFYSNADQPLSESGLQKAAQGLYLGRKIDLVGADGNPIDLRSFRRDLELQRKNKQILNKRGIADALRAILRANGVETAESKGSQDASRIEPAAQIPEPEVRPPVGQEPPLRQPGEVTPVQPEVAPIAPVEAKAPVEPAPIVPPSPKADSEIRLELEAKEAAGTLTDPDEKAKLASFRAAQNATREAFQKQFKEQMAKAKEAKANEEKAKEIPVEAPSPAGVENAKIASALKELTDIFLPPPPKPGEPQKLGSGGPDTSRVPALLKTIGEELLKKTGRNFKAWETEIRAKLGAFADRIQDFPSLLAASWKELTGEEAKGFIAQKLAAGRAPVNADKAASQDRIKAEVANRGTVENPPDLPAATDPQFQVGTWIDKAFEQTKRTGGLSSSSLQNLAASVTWLKQVWPQISGADIRSVTKPQVYGWMKAMAERASRQNTVGKLDEELAVNHDKVKRGIRALRAGFKLASLGELAGQAVDATEGLELKDVGLKAPKTLSSRLTTPTLAQSEAIIDGLTGRFKDLGTAMFHTGVRIGEILRAFNKPKDDPAYAGLRWSELNLEKGTMDLRRKRTKVPSLASAQRVVPLTPEAIQYFSDLKRRMPPATPDAEIFGDIADYQNTQFNAAVRKSALDSGIEIDQGSEDAIRGDIFRKMFATRMQKSMSAKDVADLLGNTEAVVKKWYSLLPSMSELAAKVKQVPAALKPIEEAPEQLGTGSLDPTKYPAQEVPLSTIKFSKDVPQFKGDADESGVVKGSRLEGKFERLGIAPIVLWRRKNGDLEVITGRHRLDLARRSGETTIPSQIVDEAKGFSKTDAKLFDAVSNIRDGQGTVEDYADFFRNLENITEREAREAGLVARAKGRAGWELGKGSTDDTYAAFKNGRISEAQAVAIARATPNNAPAQRLGVKLAISGKDADDIAGILQQQKNDVLKKVEQGAQGDLWGVDDSWIKQAEAQWKKAKAIISDYEADIKAAKNAAKNPEAARRSGVDVSNPEAAISRIAELESKIEQLRKNPQRADEFSPPVEEAKKKDDLPTDLVLQKTLARIPKDILVELDIKGIKTDVDFPSTMEGSGAIYKNGYILIESGEPLTSDTVLHEILHQYVLKHPELYDANNSTGMEKAVDKLHSDILASEAKGASPKLRPGEKAGDLLQGADAPFNLAGEKGVDAERIAKEKADKEAAEKAKAEFDAKNQQKLFSRAEPSEGDLLTREDFEGQISKDDTAGFPVKVVSQEEAVSLTGDPDQANANGFFDPESRTIYLVHGGLGRGELKEVAFIVREEAAHGLLRTTDGNRLIRELFPDWLRQSEWESRLNPKEKELLKSLRELGYKEYQLFDEFVAKSAAEQLPWWKAAIEKLRVFLSKVGLTKLSQSELSRVLVNEVKRLNKTGESAGSDDVFTGTPQSRRQVQGVKNLGEEYESENKEAIRTKLRASPDFNFKGEVTPDTTERAMRLLSNLTDPATQESEQLKLRSVAPEDMAGSLLINDLWDYGLRMIRDSNDQAIYQFMRQRYQDISARYGSTSRSQAGSILAGASWIDSVLWRNAREIYDAIEKAASTKLVGAEKAEEFARIIREALSAPVVTPEQLRVIIEDKLTQMGETPEIQYALRLLDQYERRQTEWLKPEVRNEMKEIVTEALRKSLSGKTVEELRGGAEAFRRKLSDDLFAAAERSVERANEGIRAKNEKIDEENETRAEAQEDGEDVQLRKRAVEIEIDPEKLKAQMDELAFNIWNVRLEREWTKAQAARGKEAAFEENKALNYLSKWAQDEVETVIPQRKSAVQEVIKNFLKDGGMTAEQLTEKLIESGVSKKTAGELAFQSVNRRQTLESNRRRMTMEREAKRISALAQKTAESLLNNFQTSQTEWNPGDTLKNAVREIIREALKITPSQKDIEKFGELEAAKRVAPIDDASAGQTRVPSPFLNDLISKLESAGVTKSIARELAQEVANKRQAQWASANVRAMERASKSNRISGLMDEILDAPYLLQQSPKWREEVAMRWFMGNGLSRERATEATRLFQEGFNEALGKAAEELAQRLFNRIKPGAESVQEFIQAFRAGLVDPSKPWAEEYAKKAGWKLPTPEQLKQLADLDLQLAEAEKNEMPLIERKEITEKMMGIYLHMRLPPDITKSIAANFIATNLTGIRTFTINFLGPALWMGIDRALMTATAPHRIGEIWKPVITAFKGFLHEFKYSMTTDAYTFINNEFEPASNELRRLFESGREDLNSGDPLRRSKGVVKVLFGSQQFFMRMLNSFDQAIAVAIREAQLVMYGGEALRAAGLTSGDVANLVQATHEMKRTAYLDGIRRGYSSTRAQVHADALVAEITRSKISEIARDKGVDSFDADTMAKKAWQAAENDAYSVIGRLAPGVKEKEEGGLISHYGFLHSLLGISSKLRREGPSERILAVSILGYLNVPVRTARFYAWNSPYGLLRLGIHHWQKSHGRESWWKQSLANEYQERYRLKQALASTAAFAVLTATGYAMFGKSASSDDTDRKNGIFVTGEGPKNRNLQDAWLKQGFRKNSVVMYVNGKAVTVPLSRLGEPLAHLFWILSARDDYNWRKKEKEASGQPFKETWDETMGYGIGNYISLLGQRGLIQNITRWARAGGSEGGTKAAIAQVAGGMAASTTMPFLGMQRSIRDMAMGRVDTSSIQSALMANFPVLGPFQEKALNRFGDPLGNQTWYGKIADTGVPIAFQMADNSENRKLYQMLVSKGIAPPVLRRAVLEEKYGVLTDDQFTQFVKKSGALLKKEVLSNYDSIQKDTQEDGKKELSKMSSSADKLAAQAIGLESIKPAKTSGGMNLGGTSSGGGLLGGAGLLSGGGAGAGGGLLTGTRSSRGISLPRGGGVGSTRPRKTSFVQGRLRLRRPRRLSLRGGRRSILRSQRRIGSRLRRPSMRMRRLSLA